MIDTIKDQQAREYGFQINPDLERTNAAPIQRAARWAQEYDGKYGPPLSLTQGVPSTPPNQAFMTRLSQEAASTSNTGYGALQGETELREALALDIRQTYGGDMQAESIVITAGCNMAAQIVLQTLARTGDEVIVPSPWYFNHEMCLDMLGIHLVPLPCRPDLQAGAMLPDVREAENLISPQTRAILLVTPNNPTGTIYSHSLLEAFFDLCRSRKIALILDETYRDFLKPAQVPAHPLFRKTNWQQTLVSLYSFSKSYSIPGHRVGAIIGSAELLSSQSSKVSDVMLICAPVAAQRTVAWAIHDEEQKSWRRDRRDELLSRAKLFTEVINGSNDLIARDRGEQDTSWQGWTIEGLGAYYAFLKHPYAALGLEQIRVAELLAKTVGVVVLPGSAFGQGVTFDPEKKERVKGAGLDPVQQHLRISIANIFADGIRELEPRLVAFDKLVMGGLR